ncbi:hypothetical protein [Streptomyces albicerus]|uniref:hypothetical protein n=1 Tax=Streptomyces albicerus TaxID=2569859 RepID=UPI00124B7C76|nr:hypothetical protein [Streptomyces albicerus]
MGAVQQYFAGHPMNPIPPKKTGGHLTRVRAVRPRVGPPGPDRLLRQDERARFHRAGRVLVEGLMRAFTVADVRPDSRRAPW